MNKETVFCQFNDLARADSAERVTALLQTLDAKERNQLEEQIVYWLPHESLAGLNEIGAYVLSLSDKKLDKYVRAKLKSGPGLSLGLVRFLIKHAPSRVEVLYRNWLGKGASKSNHCPLEPELLKSGFLDALPALEKLACATSDVGMALALTRALYEYDAERYHDLAVQTACDAMEDPWHMRSACEWMVDVMGVAALPSIVACLRVADGPFAWQIARHAVAGLGNDAEVVMTAALESDNNFIATGVAEGISKATVAVDHPLADRVFKRLIDTASDELLPTVIEMMGRWDRAKLADYASRLKDHFIPEIRTAYASAISGGGDSTRLRKRPITPAEFQSQLLSPTLSPYRSKIEAAAKRCLCFFSQKASQPVPTSKSKLGGVPEVPAGFAWPISRSGCAYSFVARLSEEDLKLIEPSFEGSLLFFADVEKCEPAGVIVHVQPDGELHRAAIPGTLYRDLVECELHTIESISLPDPLDECDAWRFPTDMLTDHAAMNAYRLLGEQCTGSEAQRPLANAFGYPHYCQGNPKFSAEQRLTPVSVVNGSLVTPPEFYQNTSRWVNLFSSWTNDEAGLAFYDTGTISFLIAEEYLAVRDFSRIEVNIDFM
ncbi:MAG: DUF1963 domain-containing protein [Verrucomicrobiaceae bacterium]|nr:DUF1963 domain-containing protein [Verrucomicrobiaceae bacterium]